MTFDTPRLVLRPLTTRDAEGLHTCFGDPEAMRYWTRVLRATLTTARRIADTLAVDPKWHAAWAVVLKETGQFVGFVNDHHRVPAHRRLEVGYILAPACWRQGLMTEAMPRFLGHCFGALDAHRVEALIEPDNTASVRLAERLGFCREGRLRDRLLVDGRHRTVEMFGLLEEDWLRRAERSIIRP